jgi:hypothetical protein
MRLNRVGHETRLQCLHSIKPRDTSWSFPTRDKVTAFSCFAVWITLILSLSSSFCLFLALYALLYVWVTCYAVTVSNASFSRSRRKPNQTTKCSAHSCSAPVSLSVYSASLILLLQNNIHGPLRVMLPLHCCSWNSYYIVLQHESVIIYIKMVLSLRILVLWISVLGDCGVMKHQILSYS